MKTSQGNLNGDMVMDKRSHVKIYCHVPDYEDLGTQVTDRMLEIMNTESPNFLYVNPICSILCETPEARFFELARQYQGQWCRQVQSTLNRHQTRKSRNWYSSNTRSWRNEPKRRQKYIRYLERGLVFTGILFIDRKPIPAGQWPRSCD